MDEQHRQAIEEELQSYKASASAYEQFKKTPIWTDMSFFLREHIEGLKQDIVMRTELTLDEINIMRGKVVEAEFLLDFPDKTIENLNRLNEDLKELKNA